MLGGFLGALFGGGGGSVGGIRATVGADITDYERKMRQADQTMKRTAASMTGELDKSARMISGGLGGIGGAIGIGGALVLAQQIGSAVTELNALGAESQRMSAAFVEQWGDRAPAAMEALRAASHGAISDMDLMLSANRAKMLLVTDDYNELGRLLEVATARGQALGIGTQQAFERIVTGIGRISPLILDDLAILTGGEATFEAYAASIGKAADELTDVEKRQALVNKVLEESVDVTVDAAGQAEALKAAKANLRSEIGGLVTDFITETGAVEALTKALQTMTENLQAGKSTEGIAEGLAGNLAEIEAQGLLTEKQLGSVKQEAAALYGQMLFGTRNVGELNASMEGLNGTLAEMAKANMDGKTYAAYLRAEHMADALAAYKAADGYRAAGDAASIMASQMMAASKVQFSPYGYEIYGSATNGYAAVQQRVDYLQIENERRVINRQVEAGRAEQLEKQRAAATKSVDIARQQFDDIRGIVESALSPTAVTAADLAATAAGTYVDKWDEYMRRIRMPESGLDAAQIAEQERLFYSGQMMDQVNWGAIVSDVQRKVQEEAGKEAMIQEAMRQVQAAGITASEAQLASAMGITDYQGMGRDEGAAIAKGISALGLGVKFTDEFTVEFDAQQDKWTRLGKKSVEWMAVGMEQGATPQVTELLVNLLVPRLYDALTAGARP